MSLCLFNVYMYAVMKEVEMRMKVKFIEEGREWRLPILLYEEDLVLCCESEDLRAIVGHFVEVCRRNGLKVIRCKNKAMILNRGEIGM